MRITGEERDASAREKRFAQFNDKLVSGASGTSHSLHLDNRGSYTLTSRRLGQSSHLVHSGQDSNN
jgi:hypothetical protein